VSGGTRDWDAGTYHRVSDIHVDWANQVLGRLALEGHETVLDAGCGSGRVTAMLLERLPRGHVVGVDAAPSMVEHAREALGPRATVMQSNLLDLELAEPVDAVFSNAVFHWVPDHPRLFERLHAALRPGGRIEAQYGGVGNVERFHRVAAAVGSDEPFAAHLGGWVGPWNFTTAEQARGWLEGAGFERCEAWLESWSMSPREPHDYIRTVCLGHHLERLPEDLRLPFVHAVADGLGDPPEIDYVRLNISARRAG
jgi:trans-aconitate 2-methyltransferase